MGVRIVGQEPEAAACLYDSVTGLAFGPVFSDAGDAEDFLEWYSGADLRTLTPREVETCVNDWRAFSETQDDVRLVGIREDGSYHYEPDNDRAYDLAKESGEL